MIFFKSCIKFIDKTIQLFWIGLLMLLPLCVVISAGNAFIRKLSDSGSNAFLELQWYLYSAIFLLASGYVLRQDGHIRIDIFYSKMKPLTQAWLNIILHSLITLPILGFIIYLSIPFFVSSILSQDTVASFSNIIKGIFNSSHHELSPNAGGLSTWYAKILLPFGFTCLFLSTVSEIFRMIILILAQKETQDDW